MGAVSATTRRFGRLRSSIARAVDELGWNATLPIRLDELDAMSEIIEAASQLEFDCMCPIDLILDGFEHSESDCGKCPACRFNEASASLERIVVGAEADQ